MAKEPTEVPLTTVILQNGNKVDVINIKPNVLQAMLEDPAPDLQFRAQNQMGAMLDIKPEEIRSIVMEFKSAPRTSIATRALSSALNQRSESPTHSASPASFPFYRVLRPTN